MPEETITEESPTAKTKKNAKEADTFVLRTIIDHDIAPEDLQAAIEDSLVQVEDGSLVEGTVVRIDRDEILLDIGYKSEGFIPANELSIRNDIDPEEIVQLGERLEALVLEKEDKDGRLKLSKKRAQYERAWGQIEKVKEAGGMVKGSVIEVVKGGLIIDVGLRGFLPASLVDLRRVRDLQPFIGQDLECKIIELDKNRNNVVLSRRAFLEETQQEQRHTFLTDLKPGEVKEGVISSVVNFGAFVDLGGMDGLVHVSELSWKHVDHPQSVVNVGDQVKVQVLEVDMSRERISLSLKACQEDPWEAFAREHAVNDVVPGKITKLVPFGAFVSVADGIEGLVHISEMSDEHIEMPDQIVVVGEETEVKIIDVDLARRRISLSIKQAGGKTSGGFDESVYKSSEKKDEKEAASDRVRPAYTGSSGFKIGDEHSEALGNLRDQLAQGDEKKAAAKKESAEDESVSSENEDKKKASTSPKAKGETSDKKEKTDKAADTSTKAESTGKAKEKESKAKDAGKDSAKDDSKESKDDAKESKAKDAGKDDSKESKESKDDSKESKAKDAGKDDSKESKDDAKESKAKDAGKDDSKESKDDAKESSGDKGTKAKKDSKAK